ncbi:hypothetical protein [Belliella aquatica]|uniref:Uncharacterized protein n=1 Tax=Belliella aquatica TaxID=1323734 RepID=A0ABQ1MY22_9BACT|nr:hypothetical protein [Belliella aquatica]MCH7407447.1 hypothetical protein [Belliella aquatica]GGC49288.1 hypothetical protein GCM10010993_29700 [Belliella aquatica]
MKNQLKNLLRGGVLMLAAVFAFAFTQPIPQSEIVWGDDPILGAVQVERGTTDYDCNVNPSVQCLYADEQLTMPIPGEKGEFELN